MELTIIAAVAENRVIGNNGIIPWNIPEDLRRFKRLTIGHPVIMGRKTYDSIVKRLGKPLQERINIVLSKDKEFRGLPGVVIVHSIGDAIRKAFECDDLVYAIGGQSVYEQTISLATKMELTEVKGRYAGDAFFPEINYREWIKQVDRMEKYNFVTYKRRE